MKIKNTTIIKILDLLALLVFIASFSPLVLPPHQLDPKFLKIPYTMWMGFAVSVVFVLLAYAVSLVYKKQKDVD